MSPLDDRPVADVAEACADALLSAVSLLLLVRDRSVTPTNARTMAIAVIDQVIERTARERAKPR